MAQKANVKPETYIFEKFKLWEGFLTQFCFGGVKVTIAMDIRSARWS